jgi:hypothetical protein
MLVDDATAVVVTKGPSSSSYDTRVFRGAVSAAEISGWTNLPPFPTVTGRPSFTYWNGYAYGMGDGNVYRLRLGAAPAKTGHSFYTIAPCRVLDTRDGTGALDAGAVREFGVAGKCSIPSSARAIAYNVTVTQPTEAGDLRIYPPGSEPLASVINYGFSQTRANSAITALGPTGGVAVRVDQGSGTVHVILDVSGYFE